MTNAQFSFSKVWFQKKHSTTHALIDLTEKFTFPQNQYLYLSFRSFKGTLKMLQITFCPQIQQEKSLKWS